MSVGIVIRQHLVASKKKAAETSNTAEFYNHILSKEVPDIAKLLENANLKSPDLKTASDWSYHATEYASDHLRIAGDAGCFIDPLFSSGVHLALNSGLSAAITICASMKGDCSEEAAIAWHSQKVAEGYTRFLLVVTSSLEQIYGREQHILNDLDEPGFDNAFDHFKPGTPLDVSFLCIYSVASVLTHPTYIVIQGTVDAGGNLTKEEIARSVDFCTNVIAKIDNGCLSTLDVEKNEPSDGRGAAAPAGATRSDERVDTAIMKIVRIHRVLDLETFSADVVNGMVPIMSRGQLGLSVAAPPVTAQA